MSTFPAWRYAPDGEARVFEREADVPANWRDTPWHLEQLDHDGDGKPGGSKPRGRPRKQAD